METVSTSIVFYLFFIAVLCMAFYIWMKKRIQKKMYNDRNYPQQ